MRAPFPRRVFGGFCATAGQRHRVTVVCQCQNCTCGRRRVFCCTSKALPWTCIMWSCSPLSCDPCSCYGLYAEGRHPSAKLHCRAPPCANRESLGQRSGHQKRLLRRDRDVGWPGLHSTGKYVEETSKSHAENQRSTYQHRRRARPGTSGPRSPWKPPERRANTLGFDSDITTTYQARHGGASRDLTLGARTTQDVTPRVFWARLGSMRMYHKARQDPATGQQSRPIHHAVCCKRAGQL